MGANKGVFSVVKLHGPLEAKGSADTAENVFEQCRPLGIIFVQRVVFLTGCVRFMLDFKQFRGTGVENSAPENFFFFRHSGSAAFPSASAAWAAAWA